MERGKGTHRPAIARTRRTGRRGSEKSLRRSRACKGAPGDRRHIRHRLEAAPTTPTGCSSAVSFSRKSSVACPKRPGRCNRMKRRGDAVVRARCVKISGRSRGGTSCASLLVFGGFASPTAAHCMAMVQKRFAEPRADLVAHRLRPLECGFGAIGVNSLDFSGWIAAGYSCQTFSTERRLPRISAPDPAINSKKFRLKSQHPWGPTSTADQHSII